MFFRLAIAATTLVVCTEFSGAQTVRGVSPGMSPKEALEAFKRDAPGIVVNSKNYTTSSGRLGPVSSLRACDANDCTVVAFGALQGRAFFISRSWSPVVGVSEILAIYGPLANERSTPFGGVYETIPNKRGKQEPKCRTTAAYGIPHTAHPHCTTSVSLEVVVAEGVVSKARLAVFDHQLLIEEIREANAK